MAQVTDPRDYVRQRLSATTPTYTWPFEPSAAREALARTLGGLRSWEHPALDLEHEPSGFIRFTTRPGLRACGWLLIPERPNGAGLVALPGHGVGADTVAGKVPADYQFAFGAQCAERGFTTLVLEQLSFGHRRDAQAASVGGGASSCVRDSMAALMLGESMTGWRVWDTMRALDVLAQMPGVDPGRLGTIGISGGGLTSLFTAALDTRVQAAVVSGYFNTFADSVLAMDHCVDNFVPGLSCLLEMPSLAGLIAPRKLFLESGTADPIFPLAAFEQALKEAQRIYQESGCPQNLASEVFEGDHHFHGIGALRFLEATL